MIAKETNYMKYFGIFCANTANDVVIFKHEWRLLLPPFVEWTPMYTYSSENVSCSVCSIGQSKRSTCFTLAAGEALVALTRVAAHRVHARAAVETVVTDVR